MATQLEVQLVRANALAEDRITTEHCQALALENDTARQVQVFEAACQSGWGGKPVKVFAIKVNIDG
ncbi:chromosome partitioning protein ParB [Escherichia coli]|nr:chromosome partitioning protein ParB [Escherichia coli]EFI3677827.1 chromosome partitioning protein ParB [Escherichia coli]